MKRPYLNDRVAFARMSAEIIEELAELRDQLAAVTKERDEARETAHKLKIELDFETAENDCACGGVRARLRSSEATVRTLAAQVRQMRAAAELEEVAIVARNLYRMTDIHTDGLDADKASEAATNARKRALALPVTDAEKEVGDE